MLNIFYGCSGLTSVTIPNSVTSIGESAFYGCSGLKSIVIPEGVNIIKIRSFSGCRSLKSVTLPSSITQIDYSAFQNCTSLESITIPSSVILFDSYVFDGCSSLTTVTVEASSPVTIYSSTFSNRTNSTLYVPSGSKEAYQAANYWKEFKKIVEGIGPNVQLKDVVEGTLSTLIPSDKYDIVKSLSITGAINANDFAVTSQLTNLETLTVSADITGGIPARAFQNHEHLKRVSFTGKDSGLYGTRIGAYAFDGCTSLTSYSGLVASLGDFCFRNTNVGPVTLSAQEYWEYDSEEADWVGPYTNTSNREFSGTGLHPFFGVSNAYYDPWDGDYKYEFSYYYIDHNGNLYDSENEETLYALCSTSLYSNSNVHIVSAYAVSGNPKLEQFYMGNIRTIGDAFLYQCPKLKKITCPNDNTAFAVVDDVLFSKDLKMLVKYPCAKTTEELTIPSTVEQISKWAFEGTQNLYTITIEATTPPTLTEGAFDDFDVTTITLHVPAGCKAAYETAEYWTDFNIVEMAAPVAVVPESTVLPWGTQQAWEMKYVFFENTDSEPEADGSGHAWYEEAYDDESWETLSGPIANISDWFSSVNTLWNTEGHNSSYCLRRTFTLDEVDEQGYTFLSQHDDDLKVWLNGELVVDAVYDGRLDCHHIPASKFQEGDNTLAIFVSDFGGEAFLDYSLGHLFFLKNIETGKYLNAGNAWDTHAVLADEPLPAQLTKQTDGSYTIFFPYESLNRQLLFVDENLADVYVDYNGQESPACRYWTITDAGNGNYHIQTLNATDTYLGNNPGKEALDGNGEQMNNRDDVDANATADLYITWALEPESVHTTAQAERLQELITEANALQIDTNWAQAVLDNANSTYTEALARILQLIDEINGGIWFEDEKVKEICLTNWDTDKNGELSRAEAGAVTDLGEVFTGNTEITKFNELRYFTRLTEIGSKAFSKCSNLKSVELPEGLLRIGGEEESGAFDRTGLTSIKFPSTLTSVGNIAFQACESLTSIDFNGCTATLEGDIFSWCTSLEEVYIPNTVTLTGAFTFACCKNLKKAVFEEGNPSEGLFETFIGYWVGSSLEEVVLPSTAILGESLFGECTNLKTVTFLSGDPGEIHFANNFQGVPDDVLFIIPEGTAENYLKRGFRNLSDKGALYKVRELFEDQVNRITVEMADKLGDGDKDALNDAIVAASEAVYAEDADYLTVYAQIDAIKEAAKAYLATATLTADLNVTGAMITNADNDYFDVGWTIGFLGEHNGLQDTYSLSNEDCEIGNFLEGWRPGSTLSDGKLAQLIRQLPAGKYRLVAKAIATWGDDPEREVTGVSLFMGDKSIPVATANDRPEFFSVEFNNSGTQDVEIGLKVESTTANWVALDDVCLYYLGEYSGPSPDIQVTDISALDNAVFINPTQGMAGNTVPLVVNLKNTETAYGCTFKLILPEGFTLKEKNGTPVYSLGTRAKNMGVTPYKHNDQTYQFVLMSSSNTISGNSGDVITLQLQIPEGADKGDYKLTMTKNYYQRRVDGKTREFPLTDIISKVTLVDYLMGDVNGDGKVSPADAIMILYAFFEVEQTNFNEAAADLNEDGVISPADAIEALYLYFSNGNGARATRPAQKEVNLRDPE